MQAGCRDCGDHVKAPHNGVEDHHLMDMTLHVGLVISPLAGSDPVLLESHVQGGKMGLDW
jgi:hypothetical protein